MRPDLRAELLKRLMARYRFKRSGSWLRKGRCPSCNAPELWANAEAPWVVRCGRLNKCGWETASRDLFPDAFSRLNERFAPTTDHPNATADAYMSFVRGLDITRMHGWYRQGNFSHPYGDRRTATVAFDIADPSQAPGSIRMERLIEPVAIRDGRGRAADGGPLERRRAHFAGRHKGLWWVPPGQLIDDDEELWIVEGCIDACTLALHGFKVAAILSCSNYPESALAALGVRPTLVWALDNDRAGTEAIQRHVARARKAGFSCTAALGPRRAGRTADWNDEHCAGRLEATHIVEARQRGALLLAASAVEKGAILWERNRTGGFPVVFDERTFWWALDADAFEEALKSGEGETAAVRTAAQITQIANCVVDFLYYQRAALTDESWYYVRVRSPYRPDVKNSFAGAQLATAVDFKKRLLSVAPGALFSGTTRQLDSLVGDGSRWLQTVDTIPFQGYSCEHKAWVFTDQAVSGGRLYERNAEDYFEIGDGGARCSVKSLHVSLGLRFGTASDYCAEWPLLVYRAFGAHGIVAAAWWLGSLFAEQIRDLHSSFPFLEIVGEAGAGKTTLIEFLWRTCGRADYEGIDPNKSTLAGRTRIMTQLANLPVSLIESDREMPDRAHGRIFDWDELKTAYNGRASRARGVRTGGNETDEPKFRAAILISQNTPVVASEAILQRIVHLNFTTSSHTETSKSAADQLMGLSVAQVSWWLLRAILAEDKVMKTLAVRVGIYEKSLAERGVVRRMRLAKNHGQIMALVDSFADLTDLPDGIRQEALELVETLAGAREKAIAGDHEQVVQFWELIAFLGEDVVDHKPSDRSSIALNLNHIYAEAARQHQRLPDLVELKKHLKTSRRRPFIGVGSVRSELSDYAGRGVWCWRFARGEDASEC